MDRLLQNGLRQSNAPRAFAPMAAGARQRSHAGVMQRTRPMLQWAFLVLGIMVFMWGTRYKLSLYSAVQPGRMPAKLCMRSSDSGKVAAQVVVPNPGPRPLLLPGAVWGATAHAYIPNNVRWLALERRTILPPSARSTIPQHSLRPPPVPARLLV